MKIEMPVNVDVELDEDADGKIIKLDMTRMLKGRGALAKFIVEGKTKPKAKYLSLKLYSTYVSRVMRRGVSYVEDSFLCKTKDGSLRIKPFLLTRKKVSRAVRKALREKCRELIEKFASEKETQSVFDAVVKSALQKEISMKLKKIYPLAFCEIRVIEIEK